MSKLITFMKFGVVAMVAAIGMAAGSNDAEAADSVWNHNGSEMLWKKRVTGYTIVYLKPRKALSKLGIKTGTVLFKGIRLIKSIKGTAYSFRKGCGDEKFKYRGKGALINYKAKGVVTFKGKAPIVRRCKLVGHKNGGRDGELKFTFLRMADL